MTRKFPPTANVNLSAIVALLVVLTPIVAAIYLVVVTLGGK